MKVLFICRGNVGRSQMAEAFYNKLSKKGHAISAGADNYYYRTAWNARIKKGYPVLKAMLEVGIDMSKNRIKKLTREQVRGSDVVIVLMNKHRADRDLPEYVKKSKKYKLWEIKDVLGTARRDIAIESHRRNRDEIRKRVLQLIKSGRVI